jgi:hypothetical protein
MAAGGVSLGVGNELENWRIGRGHRPARLGAWGTVRPHGCDGSYRVLGAAAVDRCS